MRSITTDKAVQRFLIGRTIAAVKLNTITEADGSRYHRPVFVLGDGAEVRFNVHDHGSGTYTLEIQHDTPKPKAHVITEDDVNYGRTSKTITPAQIRGLLVAGLIDEELYNNAMIVLSQHDSVGRTWRVLARAQCAEIFNANRANRKG